MSVLHDPVEMDFGSVPSLWEETRKLCGVCFISGDTSQLRLADDAVMELTVRRSGTGISGWTKMFVVKEIDKMYTHFANCSMDTS